MVFLDGDLTKHGFLDGDLTTFYRIFHELMTYHGNNGDSMIYIRILTNE
jgi:hypothetical protein